MELSSEARPAGTSEPLADADRLFLQTLVEANRVEHHGRISYMDILFELEHRYGNSLPSPILAEVARLVDTSPAQLNGFVTFYTMLSTAPRGRHVIRVCTSGPCHVSGAPAVLSALKQLLVSNGWTVCTALCVLVLILFHFPCATSCQTLYKETKSFKWTAAAFLLPLLTGLSLCALIHLCFFIFA